MSICPHCKKEMGNLLAVEGNGGRDGFLCPHCQQEVACPACGRTILNACAATESRCSFCGWPKAPMPPIKNPGPTDVIDWPFPLPSPPVGRYQFLQPDNLFVDGVIRCDTATGRIELVGLDDMPKAPASEPSERSPHP